jgi:hypothetical protein
MKEGNDEIVAAFGTITERDHRLRFPSGATSDEKRQEWGGLLSVFPV